mgnify:FL=1
MSNIDNYMSSINENIPSQCAFDYYVNLLFVIPLAIIFMSGGGFLVGLLAAMVYYILLLYLSIPDDFLFIVFSPTFLLVAMIFQIMFIIIVSIYDDKFTLLKYPILTALLYMIINRILLAIGGAVVLIGLLPGGVAQCILVISCVLFGGIIGCKYM